MSAAVVLLSGGLDSCVTTALAAQDNRELYCLHAGYGQRTQSRELRAARDIAAFYGARFRTITLPLGGFGGSNLTDPGAPRETGDLERRDLPATYVPFRNANLLAAGVSWAEAVGAENVYLGVVEEDSSGYPDCREDFISAFQRAVDLGTAEGTGIHLQTPLIHLNKAEIVRLGAKVQAPFHLSWSCYYESEEACGVCDSCLLRLRGFARAGIRDPITYRKR